jgi:hypothetical protein
MAVLQFWNGSEIESLQERVNSDNAEWLLSDMEEQLRANSADVAWLLSQLQEEHANFI